MTSFEFATATRIVFGPGSVREVVPAAKKLGKRALLVTGQSRDRAASLAADLDCVWFPIHGEPTVQAAAEGAEIARREECDLVISFGGGSAIDGGKAIAALATNAGDPFDYLEVIGKGLPLTAAPLPFIAIPTTAGTGSEVTRNAVLASPTNQVKVSLRSPLMLAKLAVIDPQLTLDLPPAITASTGLDALTQLIEPYVSIRANAMTDLFCIEGMRRVCRSLPRVDLESRTDMSYASLLGGLSLANAGLGVVHGFAAPIGGAFNAPHGAVCAALLPHGMSMNLKALKQRGQSIERFTTIARVLTGNPNAEAEDGVRWVEHLCQKLQIPPLRAYGIEPHHISDLVAKAAQASSMKANPLVLTPAELTEILSSAL